MKINVTEDRSQISHRKNEIDTVLLSPESPIKQVRILQALSQPKRETVFGRIQAKKTENPQNHPESQSF